MRSHGITLRDAAVMRPCVMMVRVGDFGDVGSGPAGRARTRGCGNLKIPAPLRDPLGNFQSRPGGWLGALTIVPAGDSESGRAVSPHALQVDPARAAREAARACRSCPATIMIGSSTRLVVLDPLGRPVLLRDCFHALSCGQTRRTPRNVEFSCRQLLQWPGLGMYGPSDCRLVRSPHRQADFKLS